MKLASELPKLSQFSLLLQGGPKTGKTTLALQFPKPYVLDCDNNIEGTIRWRKANGLSCDFPVSIPDIKDDGTERPVRERYAYAIKELADAVKSLDISTIIVDGVSKMSAYIMADIQRQQNRKEGEMQLQDWGSYDYMWRNFVTKLQATNKMFILICHEEFSDIPQLAGHILVSMPGKKIQQSLAGMFSDVWRCEVEDKLENGKRIYHWNVRAMAKTGLSLGNSLGLPDTFKADWPTINAALNK